MKISYNWLQEHIEEKLPAPDEVREKIIFHAFEVEDVETTGTDTVFDIKVLPDRAGDCLSHHGIAREVAALFGLTLKPQKELLLPEVPLTLPVEIQSNLCRRYCAIKIDGVTISDSPVWLKEKLESVGQKSINNVVDITNAILLDTGQPIHAFDTKEIDGGIVVRLAHKDEKIITLSNEEKILQETDLVIADYLGTLAIAGVKGGKEAEVTAETASIVLEIANFDPVTVRKTSRRLSLVTDASKRFENNLSPEGVLGVAAQAAQMVIDVAGGTIVGVKDIYEKPEEKRSLTFTYADITAILGSTITEDSIIDVFSRYAYQWEKKGEQFTLAIPFWRNDITGVHDLAEEVGRFVGYDTLPLYPLPFTAPIEQNVTTLEISLARAWCIAEGYREVYTYTFRKKGDLSIAHGPKDKSALRTNLSDGLKESFELNRLNAPLLGLKDIKIFEIGTVFSGNKEELRIAIADKGVLQELPLAEFLQQRSITRESVSVLPEKVPTPIEPFHPWSPYPFISRDVAVWVSTPDDKKRLEDIAVSFAREHCVQAPFLFDEFTKDGRTSVAYRFVFQAPDRTLTDEEVSTQFSLLIQEIQKNTAFEIR